MNAQVRNPAMEGPAVRAVSAVLSGAQGGDLPLFAWTLGLAQTEQRAMLRRRFPVLAQAPMVPEGCYVRIGIAPLQFAPMAALLREHGHRELAEDLSDYLARALAAACFGHRELWQDLGLRHREELDWFMVLYFPPLYRRNAAGGCWKRFLFAESEHGAAALPVCLRPVV